MITVVDKLYQEYQEFETYFKDKKEISFQITIEDRLKRGLLLASASFFETTITEQLISFTTEVTNANDLLSSFLKNKAIYRHYHTFFKWGERNGDNQFYGLLGDIFKQYMKDRKQKDQLLANSIDDFLALGYERNQLVHSNYGVYPINKTIAEIYSLYESASYFIRLLPDCLRLKTY